MHGRLAILEVIKVIILLHANPCSSASGMRSFSIALRVKIWLRSTMTQQRFNNVLILNNHEVKTDNVDLLAIANNFVCNENRSLNFGRFTRDEL